MKTFVTFHFVAREAYPHHRINQIHSATVAIVPGRDSNLPPQIQCQNAQNPSLRHPSVGSTMKRADGRGTDGPDAEVTEDVLVLKNSAGLSWADVARKGAVSESEREC